MHEELKDCRGTPGQVQVALKGLREEEMAWVQQESASCVRRKGWSERNSKNHETQPEAGELRSQLAAPPLKTPWQAKRNRRRPQNRGRHHEPSALTCFASAANSGAAPVPTATHTYRPSDVPRAYP